MFGGLRPVMGADQVPFRLWEGGGVSAISRYGCEDTSSGRRLVMVSALATNVTNDYYRGQRATYTVNSNGFVVPASTTSVSGPRDAAGFQAEPYTCA